MAVCKIMLSVMDLAVALGMALTPAALSQIWPVIRSISGPWRSMSLAI